MQFTDMFLPGYEGTKGFCISDWVFLDIGAPGIATRLYYQVRKDSWNGVEKNAGFHFCAVEVTSHRCDPMRDDEDTAWAWSDVCTEVNLVCHGAALFDGVRHMYFGDEGYVHYPNFSALKHVMTALQHLQKLHCDHAELTDTE